MNPSFHLPNYSSRQRYCLLMVRPKIQNISCVGICVRVMRWCTVYMRWCTVYSGERLCEALTSCKYDFYMFFDDYLNPVCLFC